MLISYSLYPNNLNQVLFNCNKCVWRVLYDMSSLHSLMVWSIIAVEKNDNENLARAKMGVDCAENW